MLYKKHGIKFLLVVPNVMRKTIVIRHHDLRRNPRPEHTVGEYYYFLAMKRYVKKYVGACFQCLLYKHKVGRQAGMLLPPPPTSNTGYKFMSVAYASTKGTSERPNGRYEDPGLRSLTISSIAAWPFHSATRLKIPSD